jgi:hypothetical protein
LKEEDTRNPEKNGQQDVDEKLNATSSSNENSQRRQEDGKNRQTNSREESGLHL